MKLFAASFLKSLSVIVISLTIFGCAPKIEANLSENVAGLRVGMTHAAAQKRLSEIADFERDADKNQQIWKFKDDPHYNELAIGYNRENQVRYLTAFVDKTLARERIKFTDIGDTAKSRKEIVAPHYRYIWTIDEPEPGYYINIYGDNPEYLTIFTLKLRTDSAEEEEEEGEE